MKYLVMFRNKRCWDAVPKCYFDSKKETKEYLKTKTNINGDWFFITIKQGILKELSKNT